MMAQLGDRRSIADRSSGVRQSLLDLIDKVKTTEAPIELQKVEDVLDRFKLWTGNLGALHQAHKRMSLESRLADSPEVQDQICEQLDDMQEAVQDHLGANTEDAQDYTASVDLSADDLVSDTEYTSKETEADLILSMVSECLKALFRIGILVRKATPRDRFERALQQSEYAFAAQFDINYVEERYPKLASKESSWLASRLGSANAKRRQFINYVRDHRAKLEVEDTRPTADAATTVQSSKATTFVVPGNISTSEFLQSPLDVEDDSVSLVSASTAFDNETNLRLPSLADLSPDGQYFECPICFTLQSFRKEKAWKLHAYRDLKAYVCTSAVQECEHKLFGDRDSWFNHELKHHRSLYMCKLCGCQYTATKLLQQHILDKHRPYSNEEIISIIEHGKLVPSQLKAQDCPFCDDWASILSHRSERTTLEGRASSNIDQADILVSLTHFKRHVATHQEQLAIFAVPRTVDDDEERSHAAGESNSEAFSSKDGNSQTIEASSPTCVHVSGLPRNVRTDDISRHFGLGESTGIAKIMLMYGDGFGFIYFKVPEDALAAVEHFNGTTLWGVYIKVQPARLQPDRETGEMHAIEAPRADNYQAALAMAIEELDDAADSQFRTTLGAMCEEFIASSPSDRQKWQDQYNSISKMISKQIGRRVHTIVARGGIDVVVGKTDLEIMIDLIEIPALSKARKKYEDKKTQVKIPQTIPFDKWRVKVYKSSGDDWQDQGTGFCIANVEETVIGRKEGHLIVHSEAEPGRVMVHEMVRQDDTFHRQQETILWTERQTGIDMAMTFEEAAGRDRIWKIIDSIQRDVNKELGAQRARIIEESVKEFMMQTVPKVSTSGHVPTILTESENETSDESDAEGKDEEDSNTKSTAERILAPAGGDLDEDEISETDFKEFLEFKALMAKRKKNKESVKDSMVETMPKASSSQTAPPVISESESESGEGLEGKGEEDSTIKSEAAKDVTHLDARQDVDENETSFAEFKRFLRFKVLMGENKRK